jgi:hypothetical protein
MNAIGKYAFTPKRSPFQGKIRNATNIRNSFVRKTSIDWRIIGLFIFILQKQDLKFECGINWFSTETNLWLLGAR